MSGKNPVRMAAAADAPAVADIYGPVVANTAISFETEPPSPAEIGRRIAAVTAFAPWLVWDEGGQVTGYAYAARHRERAAYRWCVDVSVYVREERRRSGVGRALYRSLFALLRLQGFHAAHAGITLPNPASVGLHESLGFVPVGVYPSVGFKAGAWHDVGWWQLELRRRDEEPDAVLSMDELRRHPGFEAALEAGARPEAPRPHGAGGLAPAPARIRRLRELSSRDVLDLAEVLVDCVDGGASVSFLWPLSRERAAHYWRGLAPGVSTGERAVLVAQDEGGAVLGTVQLLLAQPENQPHRADLCKLLVHRSARRRGLGTSLLRAAEEAARDAGKTLLVLDTVEGSEAERLYQRMGWRRAGRIPDYALLPRGEPCTTSILYKRIG